MTVEIEDRWSKFTSNTICINGVDVKKKLGHEMFSSSYYNFNYEIIILSFTVDDYQVLIYSRY